MRRESDSSDVVIRQEEGAMSNEEQGLYGKGTEWLPVMEIVL